MESTVLIKTFAILEALGGKQAPVALADLSEQVGLAKPTVHRILGDLVSLGYVERVEAGRYRLTHKLDRMLRGEDHRPLLEAAEPILQELAEDTGETVNLGVLRHDRVIYLRVIESTQALRRVCDQGTTDAFYCTALGRCLAAYQRNTTVDRLLRRVRIKQRTGKTITDPAELRQRLMDVRECGYAIERDENDLGVMCVGAPVFLGKAPCAAVSLSVPSARVTKKRQRELIERVRQAANQLTDTLNHAGINREEILV